MVFWLYLRDYRFILALYSAQSTNNLLKLVKTKMASISVIIPCFNEEKHICKCLDSILSADPYYDSIEILIIDGCSEDKTLQQIEPYIKKYSYIRTIHNPNRTLASGWNLGVAESKGTIIFAMNAHAEIRRTYFHALITGMNKHEADCIGPLILTQPQEKTFFGELVATAISHPFGVGNSKFRTGCKIPMRVDSVHMAAYRKDVFTRFGGFNEQLIRSQDLEFNLRLAQRGGNVYLLPEILTDYYTRVDPRRFIQDTFRNGYWATKPYAYGCWVARFRHLVPMFLVLGLLVTGLASFVVQAFTHLFLMLFLSYLAGLFCVALSIAVTKKKAEYFPGMFCIFVAIHIPYGCGSILGFLSSLKSELFWRSMASKIITN